MSTVNSSLTTVAGVGVRYNLEAQHQPLTYTILINVTEIKIYATTV